MALCTLYRVLDLDQLVNELIALRKRKKMSQRELAEKIGVSYTTIQDIEKRERSLWIEDLDKWLEACGANTVLWLAQHLQAGERKIAERDRKLLKLFRRSLRSSTHRQIIDGLLRSWYGDDEPTDENPQ